MIISQFQKLHIKTSFYYFTCKLTAYIVSILETQVWFLIANPLFSSDSPKITHDLSQNRKLQKVSSVFPPLAVVLNELQWIVQSGEKNKNISPQWSYKVGF